MAKSELAESMIYRLGFGETFATVQNGAIQRAARISVGVSPRGFDGRATERHRLVRRWAGGFGAEIGDLHYQRSETSLLHT
jgi:hypothetical protein